MSEMPDQSRDDAPDSGRGAKPAAVRPAMPAWRGKPLASTPTSLVAATVTPPSSPLHGEPLCRP